MERIRRGEPRRSQVTGREPVRSATVRNERSFAAGSHEHTDPAGPVTGHPGHARHHAILAHRVDEGSTRRISTHGADQRGAGAQASQPARRVGRGTALHEAHPTRNVGADLQRSRWRQDDIQHQIAEHDDPRVASATWSRGA